ncbi:protein SHORT-ROOT-like [Hibiscus syriacus]|uniref:Protein SHORT-ROOT-like n=1 Tax=Hibiscus syriacus TaxID=106335 RepID=A0A6A2X6S6_HIBSY|nr:protein SHORT-ROOT-like [Hibiscus syriacus]
MLGYFGFVTLSCLASPGLFIAMSFVIPVVSGWFSPGISAENYVGRLAHGRHARPNPIRFLLDPNIGPIGPDCNVPDDDSLGNNIGVRLFKNSAPGIVFDHVDEIQGPRKKPKILPGRGIDENSIEDILAAARDASHKALARLEAKDAAAREKAKKEEARIAQLKKIRGEKWLPSMAREMQLSKRSGQQI